MSNINNFEFSEEAIVLLNKIIPVANSYKNDLVEAVFAKCALNEIDTSGYQVGEVKIGEHNTEGLYTIYKLLDSLEYSRVKK